MLVPPERRPVAYVPPEGVARLVLLLLGLVQVPPHGCRFQKVVRQLLQNRHAARRGERRPAPARAQAGGELEVPVRTPRPLLRRAPHGRDRAGDVRREPRALQRAADERRRGIDSTFFFFFFFFVAVAAGLAVSAPPAPGAAGRAEPGVLGHRAQRRRALRVVLAVRRSLPRDPPPNVSPPRTGTRRPTPPSQRAAAGRTACCPPRITTATLAALCPPTGVAPDESPFSFFSFAVGSPFVFFAFFAFFASKEVTASDSGRRVARLLEPLLHDARRAPAPAAGGARRTRRVLRRTRRGAASGRRRHDVVHAHGRARVDGLVVTRVGTRRARVTSAPPAAERAGTAAAAVPGPEPAPRPGGSTAAHRGRAVLLSCTRPPPPSRTALVEAESAPLPSQPPPRRASASSRNRV